MKDYWIEPKEKSLNKKKIIMLIVILILTISITTITIIYINNRDFREWMDKNLFRKEILQDNATIIEVKDENSKIYAFNKNIGILSKNSFDIYNNNGSKEKSLEIEITNPIFDSNGRHIVIGEEKGQKVYLITDKEIQWKIQIEGNISQVHVNKNGYVAIVIEDANYKAVIAMYTPQGNFMFRTYLSTTRVTSVSISNDNKYLAIAEIDTTGIMIKSNIKIMSIEKAQTEATNAVEKIYNGENNDLLTKIKYQEKNKLVCMYTDKIELIDGETREILSDNTNKKITFSEIELANNAITIEEKSSGLFTADSTVHIKNVINKEEKSYVAQGVAKEIYTKEDIIALNLGSEIEFINTGGWLVKRYIAKQEITKIVMSNNIAGIVYREKIEIINL